jgi:hypothetical protein
MSGHAGKCITEVQNFNPHLLSCALIQQAQTLIDIPSCPLIIISYLDSNLTKPFTGINSRCCSVAAGAVLQLIFQKCNLFIIHPVNLHKNTLVIESDTPIIPRTMTRSHTVKNNSELRSKINQKYLV